MGKLRSRLSTLKKRFTIIEILIVMVLLMVLAALLMPAISESRKKSKFVRWYGHNNSLTRDPSCAVNFNFQDAGQLFDASESATPFARYGGGDSDDVYCVQDTGSATGLFEPCIKNTAAGCEAERFILENYHGYLRRDLDNFEKSINPRKYGLNPWKKGSTADFKRCFEKSPGGRWGRYKKALKFDGKKAFIDVPADGAIDFTPNDNFTINMWCKFNTRDTGDGLFSKCKWGFIVNENHPNYDDLCSSAQYDFYVTNPDAEGGGIGVYDADVFVRCFTANDEYLSIEDTKNWHMVTLRYDADGTTTRAYTDEDGTDYSDECRGSSTIFINGMPSGVDLMPPNNEGGIYDADNWAQSANGEQHLLLGAIGLKPARRVSEIYHFFDGEMDEFNLFRRALTDAEIKGIYEMGAE